MKIKVTKADSRAWYHGKVGHVFDVIETTDYGYVVHETKHDSYHSHGQKERLFVSPEDCEIVRS